ncbi:phospholipid carrier-dependent glycosyltransferase [Chitinivorax sp. B]|uniref:phospholipid carrier-dependent glycosyltransferase n=1 Tax=Chitinivorax sp. B TaxID=2502235 RepID=UPI001485AF16|nr:phospholipid carrier-dependent glycosyltransferase [Chitinivorax sp. B]
MSDFSSKRILAVLLLIFAVIWFGQLDYRKLVKPDEGRYAEISREMAVTNDWITPRLNGLKYFEKPPMQYWATAAAFKAFGEREWTARLWTALTGFLGVLLAVFAGWQLFGRRSGLIAGLVLGSSFYYLALGHISTLDMGVSLFLELALVGFMLAQRDQASPQNRRNWMYVVWLAMGGAMLSKGLIGPVIPGMALILYILMTRQWALLARMHWLAGFVLFAAVVVPWFVLVSHRNPEFLQFFFIHEHFQRFATDGARRDGAIWYFAPILLLGLTPWLGWLIGSTWQARLRVVSQVFQPKWLLLIWCAFIFVFFSISKSKLPAYILPMFPALALLIGDHLAKQTAESLKKHALILLVIWLTLSAVLMIVPSFLRYDSNETPRALIEQYAIWIQVGAWFATICFALAWWSAHRQRIDHTLMAIALGGVLASSLFLSGHNSLAPSNSSYHLVEQIKDKLQPNAPFFAVNTYDQTLPFYLKRTLTMVNYADELELGQTHEPDKAIRTEAEFQRIWQQLPVAYALMTPGHYEHYASSSLIPMRVLARDTRRVIITKP